MATDVNSKQAQRLWPRWIIAGSNPVRIDMGPAGSGHLVDISGGGLRVQSLVPLKRGAEIPVRIDIPGKTEPLQCSGIVVWSKSNGAAGIRFTTLIENQEAILRDWLDQLQKIATSPQEFHQRDEFTNILSHIRGAQLNQADALKVIAVRVTELTPASGAAVALGTPENMICLAASGVAPEIGTAVQQGTGLTGECILRRKMVHCQNAKNDPRVDRTFQFGSAVILPLIVSTEVRGVLEAFSLQANAFDSEAIEMLERLADAAIFISYGVVPQRRLVSSRQPGLATSGNAATGMPNAQVSTGSGTFSVASQGRAMSDAPATVGAPVSGMAAGSQMSQTVRPSSSRVPELTASMSGIASPSSIKVQGSASVADADLDLLGIEGTEIMEVSPQPTPFIKIPAYLKEEPVRKTSKDGRWILVGACVIALASASVWRFVWTSMWAGTSPASTRALNQGNASSEPVPVAANTANPTTATSVAEPASTVSNQSSPSKVDLGAIVPSTAKTVPTASNVDKKPEPAKTPPTQPLLLSPSTGKVPRNHEEELTDAPISIPAEGSVAQIVLPTTSSVPKLAAEVPRVRTGGTLIKRVEPIYPGMARTAGLQGQVELQFHILKDGSVGDVRKVSGQFVLANAAIEAVKRWQYDPVKINGEPVEVESSVKLNFTLTH